VGREERGGRAGRRDGKRDGKRETHGDEGSHDETEVGETADAEREAVDVIEDDRESFKPLCKEKCQSKKGKMTKEETHEVEDGVDDTCGKERELVTERLGEDKAYRCRCERRGSQAQ
jgi:hypothetical protein